MTRALILAAGRGKRMGNATIDVPKCLLEIDGKSLLERQIAVLQSAGISEIAIATGYKRELLFSYSFEEFYNKYWDTTNMVYSLMNAHEWLKKGDCIITYSDILYDVEILRSLMDSTHDLTVAYYTNWRELWSKRFKDPLNDLENFKISDTDQIYHIGGRASSLEEIEGQYMGIIKTTPRSWNDIEFFLSELDKNILHKIDMTSLLSRLIQEKNFKIFGLKHSGLFYEFDTLTDIDLRL